MQEPGAMAGLGLIQTAQQVQLARSHVLDSGKFLDHRAGETCIPFPAPVVINRKSAPGQRIRPGGIQRNRPICSL